MITQEKVQMLITELITEELRLVGKTIEDVKGVEDWYTRFTITPELQKVFEKWAVRRIRKVLKCNKEQAQKEFDWFNLGYGLREQEAKKPDRQWVCMVEDPDDR